MKVFFYRILTLMSASVVFTACDQKSGWERTLMGPFKGEPYIKEPSSAPVSTLFVSEKIVLSVHWESGTTDPVLCLRNAAGLLAWAQLLIPRVEGSDKPQGQITQLSLNEIVPTKDGYKIKMSCEWTAGGKEGGIVNLNKDYTFSDFALGW